MWCGILPPGATSIDDPIVLFEVVSRGSVKRDHFEKWQSYQKLASLQHYVLVERERVGIDVFDRVAGGWFARPRLEDLSAGLPLPAIDFSMPLADIYRDVIE